MEVLFYTTTVKTKLAITYNYNIYNKYILTIIN